ncbi:MAG: hypothetical protein ACP5MT_01885 [Candidatus Acidifodinimicrobium sp.]
MENLPNLEDCDYFKKSTVNYDGKESRVLIYKLKTSRDYTFRFLCPKCGFENKFDSDLSTVKKKESGKNKEYISVKCKKCGTEYFIEKFKVAVRGLKKV